MTSYRTLRIGVVAALLAVLLSVAGSPVQAQPVHRPDSQAIRVAGFGERIWNALVNLWPRSWQKEGVTIDPNGRGQGLANPNPPVLPDEGTSIDPNGRV